MHIINSFISNSFKVEVALLHSRSVAKWILLSKLSVLIKRHSLLVTNVSLLVTKLSLTATCSNITVTGRHVIMLFIILGGRMCADFGFRYLQARLTFFTVTLSLAHNNVVRMIKILVVGSLCSRETKSITHPHLSWNEQQRSTISNLRRTNRELLCNQCSPNKSSNGATLSIQLPIP